MSKVKASRLLRYTGYVFTVVVVAIFALLYVLFESASYENVDCGCSSGCTAFHVSKWSKVVGYFLLTFSGLLFIASIWRIRRLSTSWAIPALLVFTIAFYGNSYMFFDKGPCGFSLNRSTFFFLDEKFGDYAKDDFVSLNSLKSDRSSGKLLGYYWEDNVLILYRIAKPPIEVSTGFLIWRIDKDELVEHLSSHAGIYQIWPSRMNGKEIEFVGGQDMPTEAFMNDFKENKNLKRTKVVSRRLVNPNDGTTRMILRIQ